MSSRVLPGCREILGTHGPPSLRGVEEQPEEPGGCRVIQHSQTAIPRSLSIPQPCRVCPSHTGHSPGPKAGPKQQLGAPLLPFPRVLPNPAQARLQSRHSQLSLPLREVSRAWIPSDLEPWGSRSWIHPFGCFCILPAGHGHTALGFFQPGTSISPVFFPQGQREVWNVLPNPFSFLHPSSG